MIAALDVHYAAGGATAACVGFDAWHAETPLVEQAISVGEVSDYVPGSFYRRELPCLIALLETMDHAFDTVVIDGYVWLATDRPGLGRHLFDHLGRKTPVIGVAKNPFGGNDAAIPLLRGRSTRPLYITAAGLEPPAAVDAIASMHGEHRLPTLLKRADHLCRGES